MGRMVNFNDVSILVVGFDGYVDVWNHFFELLNINWPERPQTYLATSELTPEYENVKVVAAGPDSEWSNRTRNALKQIDTPYVILLLEDFFITKPVDNQRVRVALDLIEQNNIKFYQVLVQLVVQSWEKGKSYKGYKQIRVVPRNKKYALNLQAAIWQKKYLEDALGEGNYNAWQFELKHINRQCNTEAVECLIDVSNMLNIEHAIVQSKYLRGALRKLKTMDYSIDTNERSPLSRLENFKYQLKLLMYSLTPEYLVKPFKSIGRLLNIDFVTDRISKT